MNYKIYKFSGSEILLYFAEYTLIISLTAFLFYDSIYVFFLLFPGIIFYLKYKRKQLREKRSSRIKKEFTDMIMSLSTALNAGYSIENAFRESYRDMVGLYGEDSIMALELKDFIKQLQIGINIEDILYDYGNRTEIEDIKDFAEVFILAKRSGGDLNKMIGHTVNILKEKEETESEVEVLLSGKKFEQRIMSFVPFGILIYLRISSRGFLDPLYHNPGGFLVMTLCLLVYAAAFFMAERIGNVKV